MSLDLGSVVAHIVADDVEFQRVIRRDIAILRDFGAQAGGASGSTAKFDESLAAVAISASRVSTTLGGTSRVVSEVTTTQQRAAMSAERQAKALADVVAVTDRYAAASSREQQAALRDLAAQERLTAAREGSSSAAGMQARETARLAGAEASATAAAERLAAAERAAATASRVAAAETTGFRGAMGGMLKTAGELGLIVGVMEAVKKAIDITKEANDFQRAMVQVQTNADVSAAEVTKASAALLKMAGPVAAAPDELATAWYHAKSVGLDYAKSIDTTRIAAEGARVGHADLEETMNALTSTVASNIPGVKNMSSAMGQLIAIVGSGDMKLSDLNDALGSGILTVVKGYGLSLTDVGAALATFGDNNIRGAHAATMLRMAVQAMAVPAKAGSDELHRLGLTSDTLAKDMQTGGLNKAILDLKKHLDSAGVGAKEVGDVITAVFGKKAGPGVAVLVSQVDRLESKFKILNDSGASFAQKWDATTKTASFALASFGHGLEAAGIALTAKLGPAIADAVNWLGTSVPHALAVLQAALSPTEHIVGGSLVAAWHGLVAVLGPVADALGTVGHFLADQPGLTTGVVTGVLAMWAAWKAWTIARSAILGIGNLLSGLGTKMAATSLAPAGMTRAVDTAAANMQLAAVKMGASWDLVAEKSLTAAATVDGATTEIAAAAATAAGEVDAAGEAAAAGWTAALGPLAAIGLGVGLLTMLFGHNDKAAADNTAIMQGYADSLKQSADGLAAVNVNQTIKNLQDDKSIGLINQVNASTKGALLTQTQFVLAINGSRAAYLGLRDHLIAIAVANSKFTSHGTVYNDTGKAAMALAKNIDTLRGSFTAEQKQQALAVKIQRETQQAADGGADAAAGQAKSLGLTTNAYLDAQAAAKQNTDQTAAQVAAFQAANDAASLFAQALQGLAGNELTTAQAQTSVASANLQVLDSFKQNGNVIKGNTAAAIANQQAVQGNVTAAQQLAEAIGRQTHSGDQAVQSFKASKQALEDQLAAHHRLTPAVQAYIDKLYDVRGIQDYISKHPTVFDANTHAAAAKVAAMQTQIDTVRQHVIPRLGADTDDGLHRISDIQNRIDNVKQHRQPSVDVDTSSAVGKLNYLLSLIPSGTHTFNVVADYSKHVASMTHATGGYGTGPLSAAHYAGMVVGPGTGTSDQAGIYALSNREFVSTAASVARNAAALEAGNRGATLVAIDGLTRKLQASSARASVPVSRPVAMSAPSGGGWSDERLVRALGAIEDRLASIEATVPDRFAAAAVNGYRVGGAANAREMQRLVRGR